MKKILAPNDLTFIIPVRKGSERIKNKNIKKFYNTNLLELKLGQLFRIFKNPNIVLSTDCEISKKIGIKFGVFIDERPKKYASSFVPMKKVYKYLASIVKTKFIGYTNVTSPLISDLSIVKIFNLFKKKKIQSITTVHIIQEYMWFKSKAINYNPNNHPKSQNLKKILALNFAFSIIDKKFMQAQGKIISNNFCPYVLDFPEYIDIDNKKDFLIAEYIIKNKKKFTNN